MFGYGPQQITDYYFGHATKYNFGLELPHSSLFNYLIFFGIFGIAILSFFTIKFIIANYQNGVTNYLFVYLLLNFLKSDAYSLFYPKSCQKSIFQWLQKAEYDQSISQPLVYQLS